jgi:alpha-tubulin suppressor-like RCC1 family protein
MCAGHRHTAAVSEDGTLYSWGCGEGFRLGITTTDNDDGEAGRYDPVEGDQLRPCAVQYVSIL